MKAIQNQGEIETIKKYAYNDKYSIFILKPKNIYIYLINLQLKGSKK